MIFKVEKRRFRKNGVLRLTRCYYVRYRVGEMPVDRWKALGVTDRQVADKRAREFIQEKEREAAGILEPKVIRNAAMRPLAAHLEDYLADLEKRNRAGRNGRGGRQLKMRVCTLLKACNWNVAYNVNADSFIGWRSGQKNSARTLNHYLQAMVSFLNWLERVGRIKGNPLKFVPKIDERGQSKRVRRAFTDEELRGLIAGSGPRGIVYLAAARTGLRHEELRQLIWDDLRFDEKVPHVRVRVICAKNKKEEHVPLVPEIAEALKAHRPVNYSPSDLVFQNGVPQARRLRRDSERNGIAYCDGSGRYADFHALRYTWATFLQRHGIAQRFAMKLLRHSDIRLTSKVYTDESQLPIYDAVKGLPRLFDDTQIRAQIADAAGQNLSQADARSEGNQAMELADNKANGRMLTLPVALGRVAVREGFEPSVGFWGAGPSPKGLNAKLYPLFVSPRPFFRHI
jgi:integrase